MYLFHGQLLEHRVVLVQSQFAEPVEQAVLFGAGLLLLLLLLLLRLQLYRAWAWGSDAVVVGRT